MCYHVFALRIESNWLMAAEVSDETAAELLDAGGSILLGTLHDVGRLALHLRLPLMTIAPARGQRATAGSALGSVNVPWATPSSAPAKVA